MLSKLCQVIYHFSWLGLTSFGGPSAHIGHFHRRFVMELKWLSEAQFAQLFALCQVLPGPASSQLGFAIGRHYAGLPGAILAFVCFTLPSFLLLYLAAIGAAWGNASPWISGITAGLMLLALIVVLDATITMYQTFCGDEFRVLLALASATAILVVPSVHIQLLILVVAALAGYLKGSKQQEATDAQQPKTRGSMALGALLVFLLLLLASFAPLSDRASVQIAQAFYQTGSLVFGGGHVVLPLLQQMLAVDMAPQQFILGYSLAQAVPGPMFTLAAYIGASSLPDHAFAGAGLATLAVFLPGFLLLLAAQGYWLKVSAQKSMSGAISGLNAAVVGLMIAACYQPVFIHAVQQSWHVTWVLAGLYLLRVKKYSVLTLLMGSVALVTFTTLF